MPEPYRRGQPSRRERFPAHDSHPSTDSVARGRAPPRSPVARAPFSFNSRRRSFPDRSDSRMNTPAPCGWWPCCAMMPIPEWLRSGRCRITKEPAMRRFSVLVSVVIFVALVALGLVTTQSAAQEGTPAAAPAGAVGITFQARGSGTPDAALITNSGSAGSPSRQARRSTIIITPVRSCSPLSPVLSGIRCWRGRSPSSVPPRTGPRSQ